MDNTDDPISQNKKNWYTPQELANDLGVNYMTVIKGLNNGDIPGIRIGRQWRVYHSTYMDLVRRATGIIE